MMRSALRLGRTSTAPWVFNAEDVLKPAASSRLQYRSAAEESSSTRKTVLESPDVLAEVILHSWYHQHIISPNPAAAAESVAKKHDSCQFRRNRPKFAQYNINNSFAWAS